MIASIAIWSNYFVSDGFNIPITNQYLYSQKDTGPLAVDSSAPAHLIPK